MDFSKRKARLSLEPLEMREVPAQLGPVVELPYPAAPETEVAVTAPADPGQGEGASLTLDIAGLNYTKIEYKNIPQQGLVAVKLDPGQAGDSPDTEGAGKVQFQDFHFVMRANKASPTLN